MNKWTKEKVIDTFDNNLSITLLELSWLSGWSIAELKEVLLSD
jgi:hypothetical protein|tara:strand:- start:425 stop:553 length:129 start_codon:yes stop_codon:yes gene_type:complete